MEIEELYQSIILEHYKRPKNRGELEGANAKAEAHNPLCGDEVCVSALVEGVEGVEGKNESKGMIKSARFTGSGCAISQASASLMTTKIQAASISNFEDLHKRFASLLKGEKNVDTADFGNLLALGGVAAFPARVKCALLAWSALRTALDEFYQKNSKL